MAYTSVDHYKCDNCGEELTISDDDTVMFHPLGWMSVSRTFGHREDNGYPIVLSRDYCSDLCLGEALESGALDEPE